jgi:hypothetical protein
MDRARVSLLLNGAGKTTTIRMLTTLLPPSAGTAKLWGHDVMIACHPSVYNVVPISRRRAYVICVGVRLEGFWRRGKRVWRCGRFQAVFPHDLEAHVRNALRGFEWQQDQEIAPRGFVCTERRPLVPVKDRAATPRW